MLMKKMVPTEIPRSAAIVSFEQMAPDSERDSGCGATERGLLDRGVHPDRSATRSARSATRGRATAGLPARPGAPQADQPWEKKEGLGHSVARLLTLWQVKQAAGPPDPGESQKVTVTKEQTRTRHPSSKLLYHWSISKVAHA